MMRLEDDEEKKSSKIWEVIQTFIHIILIVALIITAYIYLPKMFTVKFHSEDTVIVQDCTIEDIYRYKNENEDYYRYYIKVDTKKGLYEIEISKGDFITYKTGDRITVTLKNGHAYIAKNKPIE